MKKNNSIRKAIYKEDTRTRDREGGGGGAGERKGEDEMEDDETSSLMSPFLSESVKNVCFFLNDTPHNKGNLRTDFDIFLP